MHMHARSIATTPPNSLPPTDRGSSHPFTVDTVSLILVSLVILSSIAAVIYACVPKLMQHSFRPKLSAKVPCDRCQYFSHNPYVKCALHPETVMTDRAIDCRDYDSDSTRKI